MPELCAEVKRGREQKSRLCIVLVPGVLLES